VLAGVECETNLKFGVAADDKKNQYSKWMGF